MTEARLSSDYVSYRDAAASIFSRHSGQDAVTAFGLQEAFTGTGPKDFAPAYAFLEAQGRRAVSTPVLGMLALASCPLPSSEINAVGFGVPFGNGPLVAVPGMPAASSVVVDRPGSGLVVLEKADDVRRRDSIADDYLRIMDGGTPATSVLVPEPAMEAVRQALLTTVQLGVSAELLGICDRLLDDAIAYAKTRRQFGEAIGDFQAIQHLLAWAATDLHQLRCLFDIAVHQPTGGADPTRAQAVKAMAGRTLHSVVQAATQVTGAISFTWEYSLNKLHQRGLALDQMAGPSADLVAEIGRSVRVSGLVPSLVEIGDLSA